MIKNIQTKYNKTIDILAKQYEFLYSYFSGMKAYSLISILRQLYNITCGFSTIESKYT